MTQDLSFASSNAESSSGSDSFTVLSVSIADPYVLVKMTDGSIRLLIGGTPSSLVDLLSHAFNCMADFLNM